MGGSNSKQINLKNTHSKLKNAYIFEDDNQKFLRGSMPVQEKSYQQWEQKLKLQLKSLYPQFLLLPKKWDYKSMGFCSNSGTATVDYQNYPYLLIHQIKEKKEKGEHFEESDIWYLLYVLTEAKNDIFPVSPTLGDIRPENIFINQTGMIKVTNPLSWPYQQSAINKFKEGQACYLPPEKIQQLNKTKAYVSQENFSEQFSIGLTLLSVCTLTDLSCLYDTNKFTFDQKAMQKKCNQFAIYGKYSEILKATVLNLCSLSPQRRVSFNELHNWIDEHRGRIKSKENFIMHSVPEKWHQEVQNLKERNNISSGRNTININNRQIRNINQPIRSSRSPFPR